MPELTIRPEEIRAALDNFVSSYEPAESTGEEVGHVTLTADGIARVEGCPGRWPTNSSPSKTAPSAWP